MKITPEEKRLLVKELAERMKDIIYMNAEQYAEELVDDILKKEPKPNDCLEVRYIFRFVYNDLRQIIGRIRRTAKEIRYLDTSAFEDLHQDEMSLFSLLAFLDWKQILRLAISLRPTSWSEKPVTEWRNAGDTIFSALTYVLEKCGIDPYMTKVKVVRKSEVEGDV